MNYYKHYNKCTQKINERCQNLNLIIKQNKIKYLYWGYLKKQLTYYAYNLGCTCISVPDIIDPHFWEYYHRWSQSFSLFYIYHIYTIKYIIFYCIEVVFYCIVVVDVKGLKKLRDEPLWIKLFICSFPQKC